jgi:hypothetical protein
LILFLIIALTPMLWVSPAQAETQGEAQALLNQVYAASYAGNFSALLGKFSDGVKTALTADVVASVKALVDSMGADGKPIVDKIRQPTEGANEIDFHVQYASGQLPGLLVLDSSGMVTGLRYLQPIYASKADYVTRADVKLPFAGTWYAIWGGTDPTKNANASDRGQKYAYDFVMLKNGSSHSGDGTHNADYYAYGQNVLAPLDGKVVEIVDGVMENEPGKTDVYFSPGNSVVLDAGKGEFCLVSHFQPGSISVKMGQAVRAGDVLGLCGNSGDGPEPEIHLNMQTNANVAAGEGLPITFNTFLQDGTKVYRGIADGKATLENTAP